MLETRLKVPAVKAKEPVVLPRLVAAVPEVLMLVLPVTSRVLLRVVAPVTANVPPNVVAPAVTVRPLPIVAPLVTLSVPIVPVPEMVALLLTVKAVPAALKVPKAEKVLAPVKVLTLAPVWV